MRYKPIDHALFVCNRQKLSMHLNANSLVVIHANDLMPKNTDGTMLFVQNSDLFYLSGIDQEETILLLYPDAIQNKWTEILFIKETNPLLAIWEGTKYSQEEASAMSGISTVYWITQFEPVFHKLMSLADHVYLHTNEYHGSYNLVETRNRRFISWVQHHYPLHRYERIAPIMQKLRSIKEAAEIELMQTACDITASGFQSVFSTIRPGLLEYEIEALFAYEFIKRGASGFAYAPIIASGPNSCILHYTHNHQLCVAGELLLLDVGAEYANYSADVTRVIPINGKFTIRQRKVYSAVLRLLKRATEMLRPGISFVDYNQEIALLVESELISLRLLDTTDIKNQSKKQPAYKKYFMHSISHHIGLSTHDLGDIYDVILPNMVLTIEPGIYIPAESIGIRLENNIVVHQGGIKDLSKNIPIEIEEIESLMSITK